MNVPGIQKLLVANRSEIAIRIMRACNELGIATVAVYSHEDRFALHRFKADESYEIGRGLDPVAAYLNIADVIKVALETGADAIHPGYGFLSENPALAQACLDNGIKFVGPSVEVLNGLGDKVSARKLADNADVPTVPATAELPIGDDAQIMALAKEIGMPVMVKASWGGGGRGMRRVYELDQLLAEVQTAHSEALAAFGRGEVYLEKLVEKARHVEVQVFGDSAGNVVHLFERDCTVQRRNQKVIETAPAINLRQEVRDGMTQAAVRLAKTAGYSNAGTVEFLFDTNTEAFYFIEVNPRVQVEHTVTEQVTGIDIVKAQIRIAGGGLIGGDEETGCGIPVQSKIECRGYAVQSRVTTEDPENNFMPDYGRILAYRGATGFGVRLDGGTAFSGALVTPHFDSLLEKVTAWAPTRDEAILRLSRALREFRIRGVKTNLPFLLKVLDHEKFLTDNLTTRFIDNTPALFEFPPRRDRASKLLRFMGDVLVNENAEVKGRRAVERSKLVPLPDVSPIDTGPTARQVWKSQGADGLVDWIKSNPGLLLTDTTFRDAHQSLLATRMRTFDLIAPLPQYQASLGNLFSLETWGGATFDVAYRFLKEDPWARLRKMRAAAPDMLFQMLLRGSNAVGYTNYPDNVVKYFVRQAINAADGGGVDLFRVFDSLNWVENMRVAMDAVIEEGGICEATICYTGDIFDPNRAKYSLQYYVDMAKELEAAGAHLLCIKDMAGICRPAAAKKLVETLRQEVGLPIHFHTHDTSGGALASILAAAEAGVDIADAAMGPMSGLTSQPNLGTVAVALSGTERDTGLDRSALDAVAHYWDGARKHYAAFETEMRSGTSDVFHHEMPGGQYTNLRQQARATGLDSKWPQVVDRYAEVNQMFGDIVKVTPSSKVVGDMAIFMVSRGLTAQQVQDPDVEIDFPESVISFFRGELGIPTGGFPETLQAKVLKGEAPLGQRPGAMLPPVDLHAERNVLIETFGLDDPTAPKRDARNARLDQDLSAYLLYPKVFMDYARHRRDFGDTSILPTPIFLYGPEEGEEFSIELDKGKKLYIRYLAKSDPDPKGQVTVFFELNGQPRNVVVLDEEAGKDLATREKATSENHVGAPMPGAIVAVGVKAGDSVAKGDLLVTLEAMKMETNVFATRDGVVKGVHCEPGDQLDSKDLMVSFED